MIKLEFAEDEVLILREIIEESLDDLRVEIVSTDRLDFKEALKSRKAMLTNIFERLSSLEPQTKI